MAAPSCAYPSESRCPRVVSTCRPCRCEHSGLNCGVDGCFHLLAPYQGAELWGHGAPMWFSLGAAAGLVSEASDSPWIFPPSLVPFTPGLDQHQSLPLHLVPRRLGQLLVCSTSARPQTLPGGPSASTPPLRPQTPSPLPRNLRFTEKTGLSWGRAGRAVASSPPFLLCPPGASLLLPGRRRDTGGLLCPPGASLLLPGEA